jgi:hypothetical protein
MMAIRRAPAPLLDKVPNAFDDRPDRKMLLKPKC